MLRLKQTLKLNYKIEGNVFKINMLQLKIHYTQKGTSDIYWQGKTLFGPVIQKFKELTLTINNPFCTLDRAGIVPEAGILGLQFRPTFRTCFRDLV